MTGKQFFDWQTAGGTDDVMRLVDCLERADVSWCAIGGVAVNHWARRPMVTQDVDFVVVAVAVDRVVGLLQEAGFLAERFEWSMNFKGGRRSACSSAPSPSTRTSLPGRCRPTSTASCCGLRRCRIPSEGT